jgi:hypothetical protein
MKILYHLKNLLAAVQIGLPKWIGFIINNILDLVQELLPLR